ncbi:MAG: oligosaccharide flippase family protein, partial [Flavobacteriaceae bacterium]
MGYVKRQSLKDSIVLLIATCIGAINTILIYPYFLSESQYGLIKFLLDTTGLFALFITLGSASAAVRFFPDFRNPQKQHHGFLAIPIVMTVIGSLLFLTALFISQPFWQSELAQKDKLILEYA